MVSTGGGFTTDFYIKDEGYADVKALSNKAKEFSMQQGWDNTLLHIGDKFCGHDVWAPGMTSGLYQFGIRRSQLQDFISFVKLDGFTVESEL